MTDSGNRRIPPSANRAISARHPAIPVALSFCSGFVDVTCYVGLFHSFTAFITGTVIILCAELFAQDSLVWMRAVIIATFLVSAVAWIHIVRRMIAACWPVVRVCLALESLFLVLFLASVVGLPVGSEFLSPGTALGLVFATIAMSLQNVTMQLVLHFHIPTTVMTGNFMRLLITALPQTGPGAAEAPAASAPAEGGSGRYGWSLLAFVIGGLLGAASLWTVGFWGLVLPAGLLAALALAERE